LRDELESHYETLSKSPSEEKDFIRILRTVRYTFLTLTNVRDIAKEVHDRENKKFVLKTRSLKKNCRFVNHFRDKGIAHLDSKLIEKAVMWHPHIFSGNDQEDHSGHVYDIQRAVIEACINSFIEDENKRNLKEKTKEKTFDHEIDLMFPPDREKFFKYLYERMEEAIEWLSEAESILRTRIDHHPAEDILEYAAIAGLMDFDLKAESDLRTVEEGMEIIKKKYPTLLKLFKGSSKGDISTDQRLKMLEAIKDIQDILAKIEQP
jgi:hypothetical protein